MIPFISSFSEIIINEGDIYNSQLLLISIINFVMTTIFIVIISLLDVSLEILMSDMLSKNYFIMNTVYTLF